MDFFERFEEARYEFTYGDENNPDLPVVQVGLVATFSLDKSWNCRKKIIEVVDLYIEQFGNQMTWLTFDEPVRARNYTPSNFNKLKQYFLNEETFNAVDFEIASRDIDHVGDFSISAHSAADWFENIHRTVGYVRCYFPVELLHGEGRHWFESFLLSGCELLQPLHAQAGLAIQQCYEDEEYQHIEYEIAQQFLGLDVGHPITDSVELRSGFKTVNWYTILSEDLLAKVDGKERLAERFDDPRVAVLPYAGGAMIRAGDWPELGWVQRDPKPELYVKVNRVLKPARAEKVSLAYGSIAGEVRFNARTADLWLRRFDDPASESTNTAPLNKTYKPSDILTALPGQPCPETGEWFAHQLADRKVFVEKGQPMPGPEFSATGQVIWHLRRG